MDSVAREVSWACLVSLGQKEKRETWEMQEDQERMDMLVLQGIEAHLGMWVRRAGQVLGASQVSRVSSQELTRGRREIPGCRERTDLTEDVVTRATRD
jgi:hypothetical protein